MIPYPHRAQVMRTADAAPGDLDEWGNPVYDVGDTAIIATIDCWVQAKSVQQQARIASLTDQEDLVSTHTIFCEPRAFGATDFLLTLAGGGQVAGDRYRILAPTNPDGGLDHLELDCVRVTRGV